jgi:hypothetical protein
MTHDCFGSADRAALHPHHRRMMADLIQTFALNYPGVPKIRSPFVPNADLSEAIFANKQFFFNERTHPPMNVTAPAGLCKA